MKTRKATNRQLMNPLRNILIEYSKILIIKLTLSPDSIFKKKIDSNRCREREREEETRVNRSEIIISGNQFSGIQSANMFLHLAHASQIVYVKCGMHSIYFYWFDYVVENHINLILWSHFSVCIACRDWNSDMTF